MALNNHSVDYKRQLISEEKVENAVISQPAVAYHELPGQSQSAYHQDGFKQLRANIQQLQELHGRMHFMLNEIGGVIKRRS